MITATSGRRFLSVICLLSAFTVVSCGKGGKDQAGSLSPLVLAQSDIEAMGAITPEASAQFDVTTHGYFTEIFGGTQGTSVLKYFRDRVRHIVDIKKIGLSPTRFENERWLVLPDQPGTAPSNGGPAPTFGDGTDNGKQPDPKAGVMAAANIGTLLWLEGLVNQVAVQVGVQDEATISIDSTRSGIIILGEGYAATISASDGTSITLPPEYRQAILLHEARHSDCTGGVTDAQIKTLRGLSDTLEFERVFPSFPCGHLHRICQKGDLKGLAACDVEPWGAYTIGALYALASRDAAKTELDRKIMDAVFVDQMSRVAVDLDPLLAGKYGKPDMTTQGLLPDTH